MQYLLLIYGNEAYFSKLSSAEQGKILQEYMDFTKSIAASGHYRAGNELDQTSKATTVRVRNNERLLTDGPFAETKEQLLGFYVIEVENLDAALDVARELTVANPGGAYEIRPIALYLPDKRAQ